MAIWKAGAELRVFRQGLKASASLFRQRACIVKEVGVSLLRRAPDSATQLIQLRDAENICAVDDHGVDAWHINAVFDDRSGNQDIIFPARELGHHSFQGARRQLPVSHGDRRFRHDAFDPVADHMDCFYAIVDNKYLPAAFDFTHNSSAAQPVIPRSNLRDDRQALFRRRLNHAYIADAA